MKRLYLRNLALAIFPFVFSCNYNEIKPENNIDNNKEEASIGNYPRDRIEIEIYKNTAEYRLRRNDEGRITLFRTTGSDKTRWCFYSKGNEEACEDYPAIELNASLESAINKAVDSRNRLRDELGRTVVNHLSNR